jgi:hypothetical protein
MGTEAYRTECLRLVTTATTGNGSFGEIPFYERYGQLLVAEGTYDRAISYHDHMVPLGEAIRQFVDS